MDTDQIDSIFDSIQKYLNNSYATLEANKEDEVLKAIVARHLKSMNSNLKRLNILMDEHLNESSFFDEEGKFIGSNPNKLGYFDEKGDFVQA